VARSRFGRKPQVGGALAAFVGVILLFSTPAATSGDPVNLHRLAALFIAIGIGLFLAGTLARRFYLR